MAALKETAKFMAGACAMESAIHATLLATQTTPKIMGMVLTTRINMIQAIAAGISAVLLAWYGWRRSAMVKVRRRQDYESVI